MISADTTTPSLSVTPERFERRDWLRQRYQQVRSFSDHLCETLTPEDCVVQSMPDASPVRWHLAHTTWFFETFVLKVADPKYRPINAAFEYLFNSYYNTVGKQFPRPQRGLLTRPGFAEIQQYRQEVDRRVDELLEEDRDELQGLLDVVELGLHHEQQHQELILTDIKHLFSCNPCWPVYRERETPAQAQSATQQWIRGAEGVRSIGYDGPGFHYDNEGPQHETLVQPHELATRLVTNGEYLQFVDDGGYERPEHWLSLGWNTVREHGWSAPAYWVPMDNTWHEFTLAGLRPLNLAEPVCHVSYFEADAYARWRGLRLPSEAEWELASTAPGVQRHGNFVESEHYHPTAAEDVDGIQQLFGEVWEWTASPYTPYPNYQPPAGAIGEYNGKFMCNQYVLRGGSCATSGSHIRPTYRNFFPPAARWQFAGIRLAR